MDFEEFRRRVRVERTTHEQRDAAEKRVPGERLRRAIREALVRERTGELHEDRQVRVKPDPANPSDPKR